MAPLSSSTRKIIQGRQGRNGGTLNATGRQPGVANKTTRLLKEAILLAAEETGDISLKGKKRGTGGLVGYLEFLAKREPRAFTSLLGRVLPLQITGADGGPVQVANLTRDQVLLQLRERGIPVDQLLLPPPAEGDVVDAEFKAVEEKS